MPIENELKYMLSLDTDEADFASWEKLDIKQGYLDDGPRIRKKNDSYFFTYKRQIEENGKPVQVELESIIAPIDFDRLWPLCTRSLQKTRYVRTIGTIEWCVDFLKKAQGQVYFVIAEAEMPEDMQAPDNIPPEVQRSICYTPDQFDPSFSNKNLCDEDHAAKLYQNHGKGC